MRRYNVDYLRLFGILLLFPFHAFRVFDSREANYVESAVKCLAGEQFMTFVWPWFMPLLFLISGIAAWYALQKRTGKEFIKERVLRLLIPLVLGIILIVPIQGYMARLQRGTLNGGYFNYLFTQFFPDFSDISGYYGTFTPAHLWCILYLFVISVVLTGLLVHIRNKVQGGKQSGFAKLFQKGWFLMLLCIPLSISEALPDLGGKNPFFYGLYFFIGFAIAAYGSWDTIFKIRWVTLAVTLVTIPLFFWMRQVAADKADLAWQSILEAIIRNLYGASALFTMIAFSQKYLNRGGKVLDYLNQGAFPIYIFHQSVMMVIAYFAVQWQIGVGLQITAISLLSLITSVALFEVSRRFALTRFILGIKANDWPKIQQSK